MVGSERERRRELEGGIGREEAGGKEGAGGRQGE